MDQDYSDGKGSASSIQLPEIKGELSGYAFGKGGADIFLPGAAAKAIAKGTTVARELSIVCKNLQSAEKGAGMEYIHPIKEKTSIRVMPGMPHSPNPSQQRPYVVQLIENKAVDKYGNLVSPKAPEARIPLDEFVYQEKIAHGNK